MTRQVRLDDDVAELLAKVADRAGRSLSAETNDRLRRALGISTHRAPATAQATASVGRAPRRGTRGPGLRATACAHPVGRRIGDRCADCGGTIPARR